MVKLITRLRQSLIINFSENKLDTLKCCVRSVWCELCIPLPHHVMEVLQCVLWTSSSGISKGVGFIRFDQRYEAERAIKQLNGTIPEGATEPITVKFANSPSSNKTVLPVAAMAQYLAPTRRFIGPVHHPASRFTWVLCPILSSVSLSFLHCHSYFQTM